MIWAVGVLAYLLAGALTFGFIMTPRDEEIRGAVLAIISMVAWPLTWISGGARLVRTKKEHNE